MTKTAYVTACNKDYLDLFDGWLGSLCRTGDIKASSLCLIDCGLTDKTADRIRSCGVNVIQVGWDIQVPSHVKPYFKAMTARSHLPRHIPKEFDSIMWIDADCWVQRPQVLVELTAISPVYDLCCCTEGDRNYSVFYRRDIEKPAPFGDANIFMSVRESSLEVYRRHNEANFAEYLALHPMANSGMFFAQRHSTIWQSWSDKMEKSILSLGDRFFNEPENEHLDFLVEQAAFNAVIWGGGDLRVNFLPPTYNWTVHMCLPVYDAVEDQFCAPQWPHEPINVLHMTANTKRKRFKIRQLGGDGDYREMSVMSPHRGGLFTA